MWHNYVQATNVAYGLVQPTICPIIYSDLQPSSLNSGVSEALYFSNQFQLTHISIFQSQTAERKIETLPTSLGKGKFQDLLQKSMNLLQEWAE